MYQYSSSHNYSGYRQPFYKRKGVYIFLIIIAIFGGFFYWSINKVNFDNNSAEQTNAADAGLGGRILKIEGEVLLKTESGSWENTSENYEVKVNQSIRTGEKARAIIELPDGSLVRLSEKAEVKFIQLSQDDILIEQISGHVFHRVKENTPAIYRVRNRDTEMTALGTGFDVLASGDLTFLTVTDSSVKAKVYDGEAITTMRTIEAGTRASINPTLTEVDKKIQTDSVDTDKLIADDWYNWNLEQDRAQNFALGIFAEAMKLVILEPAQAESTIAEDKVKLKGATDPGAQIYIAGRELANDNGNFETELSLQSGKNEFEILVQKDKSKAKKTISITSTKQQNDLALILKSTSANSVALTWTKPASASFQSFITLQGSTTDPLYPDAINHAIAKDSLTDSWTDLAAGKYFFRVCALTAENKCELYSNSAGITITNGAAPSGTISLNGSTDKNNIKLTWNDSEDFATPDSFKTLISSSPNPTFPGNSSHTINAKTRSDIWKNLNAGEYNFRVCAVVNGSCSIYSNNIQIEIDAAALGSISLSASKVNGVVFLNWSANNLSTDKGFKSIMSDSANISGLGQSFHLITSSSDTSDTWDNLTAGQTYYFKVCQSLPTGLGVCSTEVSLSL